MSHCHGYIKVIPFGGRVGCRDQCEHRDVSSLGDSVSTVVTAAAKREEGGGTVKRQSITYDLFSLNICSWKLLGYWRYNWDIDFGLCSWDVELMYLFLKKLMNQYWWFSWKMKILKITCIYLHRIGDLFNQIQFCASQVSLLGACQPAVDQNDLPRMIRWSWFPDYVHVPK